MRLDTSITLQKLEVLNSVVQLGGVTKAAEHLNIAQPAVTAHIHKLEEKLGIAIFRRQGRSLVLTDEGERVFRWAQDILARSEELGQEIDRINEGLAGTVNVVSTMSMGSYRLAEVLVDFHLKYPLTRVINHITNPVMATEMVRTGASDFGVILLDPQQRCDELVTELLWREPLFLIARRGSSHLKTHLSLERIKDIPFVTPPIGLVARAMEDELLRAQGVTRRKVIAEFGHPEALKRAVLADVAIGFFLGSTVQTEIMRGDLVRIDIEEFQHFFLPFYLVYRANKVPSPLELSLMTEIRHRISDGIELATTDGL